MHGLLRVVYWFVKAVCGLMVPRTGCLSICCGGLWSCCAVHGLLRVACRLVAVVCGLIVPRTGCCGAVLFVGFVAAVCGFVMPHMSLVVVVGLITGDLVVHVVLTLRRSGFADLHRVVVGFVMRVVVCVVVGLVVRVCAW